MSKITSLAIIRDCVTRLEKIETDGKIIVSPETSVKIPSDTPMQAKITDILERLHATRELVEERNQQITAGHGKEIQCIKLTNEIRHKIADIEKSFHSLSSRDQKGEKGITGLFKSLSASSRENEIHQQKLELENVGHILCQVKDLFASLDDFQGGSLEMKKPKRTTLSKALRRGHSGHNPARGEIGEMEKLSNDDYAAQMAAIETNQELIDNSIEHLIAGARNLAEYGRNFREEIGAQTEMLLSSSEHASRTLSKVGTLKKRLDRIIGERSSQNIFLSVLFLSVFVGLVGYLVYELVTFFA